MHQTQLLLSTCGWQRFGVCCTELLRVLVVSKSNRMASPSEVLMQRSERKDIDPLGQCLLRSEGSGAPFAAGLASAAA